MLEISPTASIDAVIFRGRCLVMPDDVDGGTDPTGVGAPPLMDSAYAAGYLVVTTVAADRLAVSVTVNGRVHHREAVTAGNRVHVVRQLDQQVILMVHSGELTYRDVQEMDVQAGRVYRIEKLGPKSSRIYAPSVEELQ